MDLLLRAEDGSELSLSWEAQTLDWQLCLFRLFGSIWVLSGLLTIVNTSGMEIDSRSLGLERLRLRHVIHLIAGRK